MEDSEVCLIKEDPMNIIVSNLYLGDYNSSYDYELLTKNKIRHIIRVMPEFDFNKFYSNINYIHIPIKDKDTCNRTMTKMLNKISDYIHSKITRGEKVLVHCKRGHHRSAIIVAAYLIKYHRYNITSAARYINKIRPCALRRDVCMWYALDVYQKSLYQ